VLDVVSNALRWQFLGALDLVEEGGTFVIWIFMCGVVLWALVLERWWYFRFVYPRQEAELLERWNARTERNSWAARSIRTAMISRLNGGMTTNFPMLRALVPLAPLLGLIGTVSGMLEVFDSMALRGSADARSMASGVSHAMICAMSGLAVSISGLYPVFHFQALAKRRTELLNDKFGF
jgi:biopolymer transport protein ExbB